MSYKECIAIASSFASLWSCYLFVALWLDFKWRGLSHALYIIFPHVFPMSSHTLGSTEYDKKTDEYFNKLQKRR